MPCHKWDEWWMFSIKNWIHKNKCVVCIQYMFISPATIVYHFARSRRTLRSIYLEPLNICAEMNHCSWLHAAQMNVFFSLLLLFCFVLLSSKWNTSTINNSSNKKRNRNSNAQSNELVHTKKRINELIIIRQFANEHELFSENSFAWPKRWFSFRFLSGIFMLCTWHSLQQLLDYAFIFRDRTTLINFRQNRNEIVCHIHLRLCAVSVKEISLCIDVHCLFEHDQNVYSRASLLLYCGLSAEIGTHIKWVDICIFRSRMFHLYIVANTHGQPTK